MSPNANGLVKIPQHHSESVDSWAAPGIDFPGNEFHRLSSIEETEATMF
jgi:hypothetical protein